MHDSSEQRAAMPRLPFEAEVDVNGDGFNSNQGAQGGHSSPSGGGLLELPEDFLQTVEQQINDAGGAIGADPAAAGSFGRTMFDLPNSEDNAVTVLMHADSIQSAPSQALVRLRSRDSRRYLGIVTAGPFAEPDNLKGDSPIIVTVATQGGILMPRYHGRVQVEILGEETNKGTLVAPRYRPLPNSYVDLLGDDEAQHVLHADGDIRLGRLVGREGLHVGVPSGAKNVLPRHVAVLGTTGGGKSTTVSRLIHQAQAAQMAVVVLDVEGEYTHLHEPTEDPTMLAALEEVGLPAGGIPSQHMTLFHLVGRDTANPDHPNARTFSPQFAHLSPYAAAEILQLNDAQEERFMKAYDIGKGVLRDLGIFPEAKATPEQKAEQERLALDIDEFERGYPRMTLSLILDIVGACLAEVDKAEFTPYDDRLKAAEAREQIRKRINTAKIPGHPASWRAVLGRLWRLHKLRVFDREDARPLSYASLLRPGQVSVVDLSDTTMSELSNIVIAGLLRGLLEEQDARFQAFDKAIQEGRAAEAPSRVMVIIEEAHDFLSAERIEQMPILFEQVARIARRGRKRWLGLVFVTQLPQHLPRQIFGLVNSYILHKIGDPQVASMLQKTVPNVDDSLWRRLPGLAPGQAIVSFPHMARPLLVAIDPTPMKLRMVL